MSGRHYYIALSVMTWLLCSCTSGQKRPLGVPPDAVKVIAPKGTGPWQSCRLTHAGQVHCQFFNKNGEVLYDDTFVVYAGKPPKSADELKISAKGGDQWVLLDNGTILIPESERTEMTRFLDWLFGKRATR